MINKHKKNALNLVRKTKVAFDKTTPMLKLNANTDQAAKWNEDWRSFHQGLPIKFYFQKWATNSDSSNLDLARVYAIESLATNKGIKNITSTLRYATRALGELTKDISELEQSDFDNLSKAFNKKGFSETHASIFWTWCKKCELIPEYLSTPSKSDSRDRSAGEAEKRRKKKLLDDEQVAAIGVAYNELFSDDGLKKYSFREYSKEYFTLAFLTLSASSPSRMDSEIFALPEQKLKTHIDEDGVETHSLFWKGSKGHEDNRTHILGALKDHVEKVIEVVGKESLPAKILSWFMSRPDSSLNDVMQTFPEFNFKHQNYPNLSLDIKTNIFHLGLILGFYDDDPEIPVLHGGYLIRRAGKKRSWKLFEKLSKLKNNDKIARDLYVMGLFTKSLKDSVRLSDLSKTFHKVESVLFREGQNFTTLLEQSNRIIEKNKNLNGSVDTITRGSVQTKVQDAMFVFTQLMLNNSRIRNPHTFAYKSITDVNHDVIPAMYDLQISTKRPEFSEKFIKKALAVVGLEDMSFSPHKIRHYINHHASESGIPIEIINLWSGRKDADQAYEYIHTTDEDNAEIIRTALVKTEGFEASEAKEIKLISLEKLQELRKLPAAVMSEGVCIQDLATMPCRYLNDFMTSCFGCSQMCYIKGDGKVLGTLNKDLGIQVARLRNVESQPGFTNNKASQKWYEIHFSRTSVLKSLIDIRSDDSIPNGSSVKIVGDLSSSTISFKTQNLDTGEVTTKQVLLQDSTKELKTLIDNEELKSKKETGNSNPALTDLLASYGVANG
ncbi:MAG: hypothetical protein HUJ13_03815 [Hydrogenovibrio crunogenus]|nr:hypothetical protein [Hydrogenovibrio crunogenus]